MSLDNEAKLESALIEMGLVAPEQLDLVKVESVRSGKGLERVLLDMKIVDDEGIVKAKSKSKNALYVNLLDMRVSQEILSFLPRELAVKYHAVPFGFENDVVSVAMLDPNNVQTIEFIGKKSGKTIRPYMASEKGISNVIDQYKTVSGEVSAELENLDFGITAKDASSTENLTNLVQDAPVTRAVNTILEYAVKSHASDIHIEPREKTLKVRYRIDGILIDTMNLPVHIHSALVSRIKIMSNMKIDEHRIPQDGRFDYNHGDKQVDLRVSLSPTVFGEKVVMRLLDKSKGLITLEELGIRGRAYKIIEAGSKRPHGMVLSTGPTGSGKSTTLYALLNKMNKPEVNIITLEDPVEYMVDGVNQIQVNAAVGLSFAAGLRSILRQDPDIIMVGEIRDTETAALAVQSALTGHTVLSTLHTNNAAGVLPRLLEMEIEPFLVTSTVSTVIGQRLVRKICDKCKQPYEASLALSEAIRKALDGLLPSESSPDQKDPLNTGYENLPFKEQQRFTLYRGAGCDHCEGKGYQGRVGIFEVFAVSDAIEKTLLMPNATSMDIQKTAVNEGMTTMRQDGFLKALTGVTTIEEVVSKASEN